MILSQHQRAALPASEFAGPGRSFPVNDPTHARLAIAMAPRAEHAGNISAGQAQAIQGRARVALALMEHAQRK